MKLYSLSTNIWLACLLSCENSSHAFHLSIRQPNINSRAFQVRVGDGDASPLNTACGPRPTNGVRLHETRATENVSDVQKAVNDFLQEDCENNSHNDVDNDNCVVNYESVVTAVETISTSTGLSKDNLVSGVQEMMDAEPAPLVMEILEPEPEPAPEPEEELIEKSEEEAAVSASLYMNPATAKIAQHVKITWEPQVADILRTLEKASNPKRPFMVGIVGIPGSGKSTSAEIIQALLNTGGDGDGEHTLVMPMDGFHIPLAELADLENAADAIYRRGAPDTFHAAALQNELQRIVYDDGQSPSVSIPGFDHAIGDPTPNQHTFDRQKHRIVLCEGLYLLHDDDGWEGMRSFFDWTIYIDADVDLCIERLKERNKCIPGYTPEEIEIRCDEVDRNNAEIARDGAYKYASQIVSSGAS